MEASPRAGGLIRTEHAGGFTIEELSSYKPWRVFGELPPPSEFLRLIDEPAEADPHVTSKPADPVRA